MDRIVCCVKWIITEKSYFTNLSDPKWHMSLELSRIHFQEVFATEPQSLDYLKAARWPAGVTCLSCGGKKISEFMTYRPARSRYNPRLRQTVEVAVPARRLLECRECKYRFRRDHRHDFRQKPRSSDEMVPGGGVDREHQKSAFGDANASRAKCQLPDRVVPDLPHPGSFGMTTDFRCC